MVLTDSVTEKKWLEAQSNKMVKYFPVEIVPNKKGKSYKNRNKNTWNLVLSWLKGVPAKKCQPKQGVIHQHVSFCSELPQDGRLLKYPPSSMTRTLLDNHDGNKSVKEVRARSAINVTRSHSFGGMSVRSQASSTGSTPVLGDTLKRSPKIYTKPQQSSRGLGFTFRKSAKIPKIPRPNRALLMFNSMKKGIREFIHVTQEDIMHLQCDESNTSTAQGRLHETEKQIKSAERYLKKLEFHLSKIDELHDCYLVHQQLREGARTMARAYTTSPGNRKQSLTNVKYGYKECSQTLCAIEAQLENMLGTFQCKLKGMAGFARLCPGDVFEVSIRHGPQKWKSKGRIEKGNSQRWDQPEYTFKALVGEVLGLKAVEVRSFKSVLLGQKNCEIKDLFSANPQLMTVSINFNGSLKLSIIITWNPLDGMDENLTFFEAPVRPSGTPRRRPVSVLAVNGQFSDSYGDLTGPERRYSSPMQFPQTKDDYYLFASSTSLPNRLFESHSYHASPLLRSRDSSIYMPNTQGSLISQTVLNSPMMHTPAVPQYRLPGVITQALLPTREEPSTVEEALNNLTTTLEDFLGQYNELQKLEEVVLSLEHFIRKRSQCNSRSSSISVSIESALEAFDFLNTEESIDDLNSSPHGSRRCSIDQILASPESTAKTGDSGIESLAKRLSEDTQLSSSLESSPVPPSTGNDQVDQALLFHLSYCDRLLENLGNFGPLKCREFYALDKLQKQAKILENLFSIARVGPDIELHPVMTELTEDKSLREFWVTCVDHNVLYVHPEKLAYMFEQKYTLRIKENFDVSPVRVFSYVMGKILDVSVYEPEKLGTNAMVTLHQFLVYFMSAGGLCVIDKIAEEISLADRLCSGNPDQVIKAILTLREEIPSPTCLKVVGMLLVSTQREIQQSAASYLKVISRNKVTRDKAMVVFVEALEDQMPDVRAGACGALSVLEASESTDQLVFVCQADSSSTVRRKAKEALFSLGENGRQAFEDAQLTSHGFQGLHVKK